MRLSPPTRLPHEVVHLISMPPCPSRLAAPPRQGGAEPVFFRSRGLLSASFKIAEPPAISLKLALLAALSQPILGEQVLVTPDRREGEGRV